MLVAQVAPCLGMKVVGYDPHLSVTNAWKIPKEVSFEKNLDTLLSKSDYITLHVPAVANTKEFINTELITKMKQGVRLLNFSRAEIVKVSDIIDAVDKGKIASYVHDFADRRLLNIENIITLPHLGASTPEAEENCAVMVCEQVRDYLENGNISNSVNFPSVHLDWNGSNRLSVIHDNIPKMLGQISDIIGDASINILDMINSSDDTIAYTLMDLNTSVSEEVLNKVKGLEGVKRVRVIGRQ